MSRSYLHHCFLQGNPHVHILSIANKQEYIAVSPHISSWDPAVKSCEAVIMSFTEPAVSWLWALVSVYFISYVYSVLSVRLWGFKAPLVGTKSMFEPRFVGNLRFFQDASSVINEGYNKVGESHPAVRLPLLTRPSSKGSPSNWYGMTLTLSFCPPNTSRSSGPYLRA